MEITYLGHSCFLLKTKTAKLICDPYSQKIGFKMTKLSVDIVTVSHEHWDHNEVKAVDGEAMVINGPGEYEIQGISITGITSFRDDKEGKERGKNTIYVFEVDELRVVHLGDLGHKLSGKQLEELDGVDVLMIPVGGHTTIEMKKAKELIKEISPQILIPMHYKTKEHYAGFKDKATVKDFVGEMEMEVRKEKKLKLKKLDLPEEMELVILEKYGR